MKKSFVTHTVLTLIDCLLVSTMKNYEISKFGQLIIYSSVIRQKGETHNGCFKKTKHAKFSVRVRITGLCSFFGKFGMRCFLETPFLRFALLLYYRRFKKYFLVSLQQSWLRGISCSEKVTVLKKYYSKKSSPSEEVVVWMKCLLRKIACSEKCILAKKIFMVEK